jgi:hypothetical protein
MPHRSLWEDIVFGLKHDVLNDDVSRAALRAYQYGICDLELEDIIRGKVHNAHIQLQLGAIPPFRTPKLFKGDIVLGNNLNGDHVLVEKQWLNAGMFIGANTGGGKTTLQHFLFLQLISSLEGLWMTDLYKAGHRSLLPVYEKLGVPLAVLRGETIKLNLLQPDGDPHRHVSLVVDVLGRVLQLPSRALAIVRTKCHQLYTNFGVFKGTSDHYPVLYDLYNEVKSAPGLNKQAQEAILDRLGALLVSLTPKVAAWRLAWKPSDLTRRHIVWELGSFSESAKSILSSYLQFSVLYSRLEEGQNNVPLNFMMAFDDSQRYFAGSAIQVGDLPPLDEVAGLIRGTGTSLCGAAQTMNGISRGLLPNLATKIMGRLGSHRDYQYLGADMGMTQEQISWAKLHLKPGLFVASLAEGPWRQPFPLAIPRITLPGGVTDQHVSESAKQLDHLSVIPASEFDSWTPYHTETFQVQTGSDESGIHSSLNRAELRLLQMIILHPAEPSSAYAKYSRMSSRRATETRKSLIEKGMLTEHSVQCTGRGRPTIILEPSLEAIEVIEEWAGRDKGQDGS